jgi:hypothetical protein
MEISNALDSLRLWVEEREYAGYEPYDLLNSPRLAGIWPRSSVLSSALIQVGKRFGGVRLRRVLEVPPSRNPKALGLFLSGYCDLQHCGGEFDRHARVLKSELQRMRAPGEAEYSWGYDWNYVSLRGSVLARLRQTRSRLFSVPRHWPTRLMFSAMSSAGTSFNPPADFA